ncbi:MAG: hypothetical protein HC890_11520 [Chloroflexaceae bacterium]|nr:hypothetical protein [Chloroflexaceae bacterium]
MANQEFNWEEIDTSALIEGLTAVLTAPIILPLAAGMGQPATKTAIKEAIAFPSAVVRP